MHFDADLQQAAKEYELIRCRLMKFFECKNCTTASDLTDETINRVARRISEGEDIPRHQLKGYFYGVAGNVLKEHRNRSDKITYSIDVLDPFHHPVEDPLETIRLRSEKTLLEQLLECLESCVKKLPETEQKMILVYYEGEYGVKIENRKKVAQIFGLNINNLRIRVYRIREKLEKCVQLYSKEIAGE